MVAARPRARPSDKRAKSPSVLLTGFDPFGGDVLNPSWLIAQALHRRQLAGHCIIAAQLPTVFGDSLTRLNALLAEHRPALVICLGLAATRAAISLERIAINVDDARIPDNAGRQPIDLPVVAGGPDAYFTTLPIKAIQAALRGAGIPSEVSQTAGTFVCNHVFYGLMHALRGRRRIRAGFMHVPRATETAAAGMRAATLPLSSIAEALRIAVRVALSTNDDARIAAGAID